MHPIDISIDAKTARKLIKGQSVQLKPQNMTKGKVLMVHHETAKRYHKAKKMGKGMRIILTVPEIEASGIMDWFKSLGNMVTLPFKKLAPVLKPVAKALAPVIAPVIASKTGLPVSADLLEKGVDVVGNLAGVGMKKRGRPRKKQVGGSFRPA